MQVTLSLHERLLLETWLPRESKPGEMQTDARSLVATGGTLDVPDVDDRLTKVRQCLADLRCPRSMLDVRPPLGRGHALRQPAGTVYAWISPWEEAWLVVDRGRLDRPAIAAKQLEQALRTSVVNAVAIAVLCFDSAAEGEQFARAVAEEETGSDRVWLQWLGGDGSVDLAGNLTDTLVGETPKKALQAALAMKWSEAEALLPKPLRKPFPKPIQASGTRMHGQLLAQLASHALRGEPARAIIDASLATLFGFFGFDKGSSWWDGREVMTRLPLLALYGRQSGGEARGAELLHAQRRVNAHLVDPPPRTFVGPPEVVEAIEKLETILAAAAERRGRLSITLTMDGNVYSVV